MPTTGITLARRRTVLIGAVVALLIGFGSWRLLDSGPEASPDEVIRDFFQAQRDGDCQRLLEVLSEASWSGGGERSQQEFLDLCPDAIAGYEPSIGEFTIRYDDEVPDQAFVELVSEYYDDEDDMGSLVREDGEWKIETDERTLRLGPPAEQALRGYLEAYRSGDCEAITTYVAEETWSENGTFGREEFLRQCEARADARDTSPATGPGAITGVVYYDDPDVARAGMVLPDLHFQVAEQIWLHQEGLRWMVHGDADLARHSSPGTHLRSLRLAESQSLLVRRPTLDGRSCHDHFDSVTGGNDLAHTGMPRAPRGVDADIAVTRDFSSCSAAVTLYEFADADAARTAAERLSDEVIGARPDREVDVPGHPSAIGVRLGCDVDDCTDTKLFLAHGHRVIGAYSPLGDLDIAVALLEAQLREL